MQGTSPVGPLLEPTQPPRRTKHESFRLTPVRPCASKGNWGYNAANGGYDGRIEAGTLDPTEVVRSVLQNAAPSASLVITSEAMVARLPQEEAPMGADDMSNGPHDVGQ